MKIYINGRFLTQNPTGVQYFAQEICKELELIADFEILVPNQPIINTSLNHHRITTVGSLNGYLWEQFSLPNFIKKQPNSILINLCNLAPIATKNQIITIHDLAFMINKSWFSKSFQTAYNFIIPKIAKNSRTIITVSETIKKEIVEKLNVSPQKVHVLYNKVSNELVNSTPTKPNINIDSKSYYLMVGSVNPRKNFEFVNSIFSSRLKDKNLIIVGAKHASFNQTNINEVANNIQYLSNINPNELSWLYQNCLGFINPSFYEGFGIPNIETMYFQIPLLCSDINVFREVCGDYASYFKLGDTDDFIQQLNLLETNFDKTRSRFDFFQNQNRAEQLKLILNL